MGKRQNWKAETPQREHRILQLLDEGDKGFLELLERLGWGRRTLSLYLKSLKKKGYITREKKGRRRIYSLVRKNPNVMEILRLHRVIIESRIELDKLNEEQFILDWLNTVKFSLLNIIQDFMLLGERSGETDVERVHRFLAAHVQDVVDAVTFHGAHMAKRVRLGTFKPEKIWEVRNKLKKQIINEVKR